MTLSTFWAGFQWSDTWIYQIELCIHFLRHRRCNNKIIQLLQRNSSFCTVKTSKTAFQKNEQQLKWGFIFSYCSNVSCCVGSRFTRSWHGNKEGARKLPTTATAKQGCDRGEQFWLGVDREHWQDCWPCSGLHVSCLSVLAFSTPKWGIFYGWPSPHAFVNLFTSCQFSWPTWSPWSKPLKRARWNSVKATLTYVSCCQRTLILDSFRL